MYSSVHCSTIYNSQNMEGTYMSMSGGMGKEVVVYTYNGILLNHKNEWIPYDICLSDFFT